MPLKSTEALYTDLDPAGPQVGRVIKQGEPGAKFRLVGEGGVISDELAKKFNLKAGGNLTHYDLERQEAENDAINKATYEANAARGGALTTPIAPASTSPILESPAKEAIKPK